MLLDAPLGETRCLPRGSRGDAAAAAAARGGGGKFGGDGGIEGEVGGERE